METIQRARRINGNFILMGLIALKFLIHFTLISPEYDLQRDEFLHLDQANHLAWGFMSVPPLTSWISFLIKMLGNTLFWIKFFPALFGALTIALVWKTIEALKGDLFACLFGACCVTFSVLFRLNILYQPNSFDVLSWTACFYFFIKYLGNRQSRWIYALAISFALGFLNKYNIAFLLIGLLPAIAFNRERKIFTDKKIYYGIALAFVLILPNLIWQMSHHFPVMQHMKELSATQLVHVNRWDFIRSQLLFFPVTFLVVIFACYALLRYPPFKPYRLFFWSFVFTIAVFLFLKAKAYYAIGLYPIYFAFGAVYISSRLKSKAAGIIRVILVLLSIALFIPNYRISFPNKSPEFIVQHPDKYRKLGMLTWEDGKIHPLPQDFADMLGWKELARKVDSLYGAMPNPKHTLILCDNYGQAGAINYYSKRGVQASSFSADYLNWMDVDTKYDNLIRVKVASESEGEMGTTAPYFEHAIKADSISNRYAREYQTSIFCFTGAKIDINARIRKELAAAKKQE